jgi:hypothetical protein
MTVQIEALMEKIQGLPPEQIAAVERFVDPLRAAAEAPARRTVSEAKLEQLAKAEASMRWVAEHRAEYVGRWVVLDGNRLVGSGTSGADVRALCAEARRQGTAAPFVTRVDLEPEGGQMGGWL